MVSDRVTRRSASDVFGEDFGILRRKRLNCVERCVLCVRNGASNKHAVWFLKSHRPLDSRYRLEGRDRAKGRAQKGVRRRDAGKAGERQRGVRRRSGEGRL